MSPPPLEAPAPVRLRVVTADSAAYARVLPRCPQWECVGISPPTDPLRGLFAPPEPERLLLGADLNPDQVLSLLGMARQQGISVWLADASVLEFAVLAEVQHAFAAAELQLHTGQPLRHRPLVETVREALRGGQLGEPAIVRIHDWRSTADTQQIPAGWELRPIRQYADLICWLLETTPDTVWATRPVVPAGKETDPGPVETLQFHAGGPGPAMIVCDLAHGLPAGDAYWSLSVIGSRGAAYADDHRNRHLLFGGGPARAVCTGEGDWPLWQQLRALPLSAPGGTNPSSASPAPGAAALSRAIEQSLRSQRSVPLATGGGE